MKFETKDSSWTKDFKIIEHTKPFRNPFEIILFNLHEIEAFDNIVPCIPVLYRNRSMTFHFISMKFLTEEIFSSQKSLFQSETFHVQWKRTKYGICFFFFLVKEKQNELQKERKEMKTKKQAKMKIKTWRGKKNQKQIE